MTDSRIFDPKITLGNVISICVAMVTLLFAAYALKDKVEETNRTMARIEINQDQLARRMDDWYARLIILEEHDRLRQVQDPLRKAR